MPIKKAALVILFSLSFLISPVFSEDNTTHPLNIPQDVDQQLSKGFKTLYEYKFEEALQTFKSIDPQIAEKHPMVHFGITTTHWFRLSTLILETDEEESAPFLESVDVSIEACEALIDRGDPTGEGHLVMGGILGLYGRHEATNRNWLSAYFKGKKAYSYLEKSVEINPNIKDAYFGLGMFDYYVATLPSVVRILAFLGANADSEEGIKELWTAAAGSEYARTPSKLFLAEIYNTFEEQPENAVEVLEDMKTELPESPIVLQMLSFAYYNNDRPTDLQQTAENFISHVSNGTFVPDVHPEAYFCLGLSYFKVHDWEKSAETFKKALKGPSKKNPYITFSRLYRGYALDMLGKREEAEREYQVVLKEMPRWGSHDFAKQRLKKPFSLEDEELHTIRL